MKTRIFCLTVALLATALTAGTAVAERPLPDTALRVATFDVDATPPTGSQMAYQRVHNLWDMGLRARGIVLLGAGQPIVLAAVDWLAISNESQDEFKLALARAADTSPDRVVIHTLHQHDAPRSDFNSERILKDAGLDPNAFEGSFAREVIRRLEDALRESLGKAQPVTHLGLGKAEVYKVASNRRILGKDGLVRAGRMSSCKDPALREEPEGTIDPELSLVSFWNNDKPLAILSYYATHPQSYYMTNVPSPDFPGVARFYRQMDVPDALHVHFTGAAGNVAAGKYNDGSKENRARLAERLADGMQRAWKSTVRTPVSASDVAWEVEKVRLPPAPLISGYMNDLAKRKKDPAFLTANPYNKNATQLAWLERWKAGKNLEVGCLTIGSARMLTLPGELFVEYQLAAKSMRPDLFVTMAAYVDCGPGYIGTAIAYQQGGYEITVSNVGPESESILMTAIRKLLKAK